MPTELTPDEHIKVLHHEIEELKKQVFVLTDKANQALIAGESMSAMIFGFIGIASPKDRKKLLNNFVAMQRQLDASPINKRRTEIEMQFQEMFREGIIAHLRQD